MTVDRRWSMPAVVALTLTANTALALPQVDPTQLLSKADADRDGRVTRAEYQIARDKAFSRMDRNRNGWLDDGDLPKIPLVKPMDAQALDRYGQALDANRDGRVTRSEFVKGRSVVFETADSDRDGVVTKRELASFRREAAKLR